MLNSNSAAKVSTREALPRISSDKNFVICIIASPTASAIVLFNCRRSGQHFHPLVSRVLTSRCSITFHSDKALESFRVSLRSFRRRKKISKWEEYTSHASSYMTDGCTAHKKNHSSRSHEAVKSRCNYCIDWNLSVTELIVPSNVFTKPVETKPN